MQNLLKRNKTMFTLSIIALILFVLFAAFEYVSNTFDIDINQRATISMVVNTLISIVLLIGLLAVYVLWTPSIDGGKRKRPTWQFVLLIIAIVVSVVTLNILNRIFVNSFVDRNFSVTGLISVISNIIKYSCIPLVLAILIMLLLKGEKGTKKILIVNIISFILPLVSVIFFQLIISIDDRTLKEIWLRNYSIILSVVYIAISLLLCTFTIIYTKQKYNEVKPPIIDKDY